MNPTNPFKLTYATMFNPPEELHQRFEVTLEQINANLGQEYGMWIDGKDHFTAEKFEDRSPADIRQGARHFPKRRSGRCRAGAWLLHGVPSRPGAVLPGRNG